MKRYLADCGQHSMEIEVPAGTDLDSTFTATDLDNGGTVRINGWLWTFEEVA